jgi:MscS family membrane protein
VNFDVMFLNNSVWQWLVALLYVAGGFCAGLVLAGVAQRIISRSGNSSSPLSAAVMRPLRLPLVLLFVFSGFFLGFDRLVFSEPFEEWERKILSAIFIVLLFWLLTRVVKGFIKRHISQIELQNIMQNSVTVAMCIVGAALIANALGYNVSAILAGLGIGGAAIALASKATLENIFGSISVFTDKPFHLNDRIKLTDKADTIYDGWVVDMGLRISRIRTLDNRIITIPNSFFTKYPIQNVSSEPHTKVVQTVSLSAALGREKIERALSILRNLSAPGVRLGDASIASLSTLSSGVLKITFIFFIAKDEDYWATINAVNLEALRQFEEAGVSLAGKPTPESGVPHS